MSESDPAPLDPPPAAPENIAPENAGPEITATESAHTENAAPRPLSLDYADDRIRTVFGLTSAEAIPECNEQTHRRYAQYLAEHLALPAEVQLHDYENDVPPQPATLQRVLADGPLDHEEHGVPVEALVAGQLREVCFYDVEFPGEGSPNATLVDDYVYWLEDASYLGEDSILTAEDLEGATESYEDEEWDDEADWDEGPAKDYNPNVAALERSLWGQATARRGDDLPPLPKLQPEVAGSKVGRNDPCPCGSGKKFKKCCLKKGGGTAALDAKLDVALAPSATRDRLPKVPAVPKQAAYRVKVTLHGSEPEIWRRFIVPDCTLEDLHDVLQRVMGWTDDHLHAFSTGKKDYTPSGESGFRTCEKTSWHTISSVLPECRDEPLVYEYDFGDSWTHALTVEETLPPAPGEYPVCLEGCGACPPEDTGGIWRYNDLVAALRDREGEDYADAVEWFGEEFDPGRFDIEKVNRHLAALRPKPAE